MTKFYLNFCLLPCKCDVKNIKDLFKFLKQRREISFGQFSKISFLTGSNNKLLFPQSSTNLLKFKKQNEPGEEKHISLFFFSAITNLKLPHMFINSTQRENY